MDSFHLKIVTADGVHYDGRVQAVTVRTVDGDISVWAHHINLVTALGIGKASVTFEDGSRRFACCSGGVLTVLNNSVTILASTFEWREDIDPARAAESLKKGRAELAAATDEKRKEIAQNRIKRAMTRQQISHRSK